MKWLAIFVFLLGVTSAQELTKERLWTGTNGKSFRGIFIARLPDGKTVEIASSAGKIFTIALENLCEADQKLISGDPGTTANPPMGPPTVAFKPLPPIKRDLISAAPNEDDGFRWPNSITQAIGSYLFWWDLSNIIEIPRRGDAEKKCDWVMGRIKKDISPRNSKLETLDEVMAGIAAYFERDLKGIATYRFHLVVDPTPERIGEFTEAGDACFIQIANDGWGIWLPVIDVQPNDIIRVAYRGKILFLKWTAGTKNETFTRSFTIPVAGKKPILWSPGFEYVKARGLKIDSFKSPTLEVMNKNDAPSHWTGDELIFVMDCSDPMIVCRPYVFADPEKIGPPPLEPGFGPTETSK